VAPITDPQGHVIGAVLVFQDITQRRQAEQEREQLIAELQEALATIKVLSGIIPICANCKKFETMKAIGTPPKFTFGIIPMPNLATVYAPIAPQNYTPNFITSEFGV